MDKNNLDTINNILDIDKKIYTIYKKLSELEEQEDDKLFDKYKYILKILITSENILYSSLDKNYEFLIGFLEHLEAMNAPDFLKNPIYAICDYDNMELLSYYRIYEKIKILLLNYNKFFAENLDNDLKIFESNKDDSLNYLKNLNYNISCEFHRMNILFLGECNDLEISKRKYIYSFISPSIEEEMINNDFTITKCTFWDNLRTNSKYNIFENYIFSKFGNENTKNDLKNLLDFALIEDFNIIDSALPEDLINFKTLVCSFKSGLLFLSDDDIIELRRWIVYYSNDILNDDNINNIDDLQDLENMPEDKINMIERLNNIKEYLENILDNINVYRRLANRDGKKKII